MDFLSNHAGLIGLIFFVCVFMIMLAYVFRPGSKQTYESHGNIPLKGDDNG